MISRRWRLGVSGSTVAAVTVLGLVGAISASGLDTLATSKTSHFAYRHLYVVCAQRNDLREVIHHSTVARKSIATCSRRRLQEQPDRRRGVASQANRAQLNAVAATMASILAPNMHFAKTGSYSVVEPGKPQAAPAAPAPSGGGSAALSAACTRQASTVKQMKKDGKPADQIEKAVEELKRLRAELAIAEKANAGQGTEHNIDRKLFDETVLRRMFVVPAFEIHGGVAGLFDYGPPGCALKQNIVDQWRRHFVLEEKMLEMECTCLTPEPVLKTSGHVDRFTDLMVKDVVTGDCYRADKLLEDHIDDLLEKGNFSSSEADEHRKVQRQADAYSPEELGAILEKYGIKATTTGNDLTKPFAFNLMFGTKIGPSGALTGFLRPETAQGLFVNFKRLLDYNNGRVPFAAAQIGLGFRNEIAPKNGLLRVREFTMAEIEHFVWCRRP